MRWQKHDLSPGEGQHPRGQGIVKQVWSRQDVSGDTSMCIEFPYRVEEELGILSNQRGTYAGQWGKRTYP